MKKIGSVAAASLVALMLLSSCVTSTRVNINSDVTDAAVYIDGEKVGQTPLNVKLSNAIWEDPDVVLKKDGYKDLHTDLRKEVKAVNLVFGILGWYPSLLWVYGPKKTQNFMLTPSAE